MTRAEQLAVIFDEFNSSACECECEAGDCIADRAMADEIIRLRAMVRDLWQQRFAEAAEGVVYDNAGEPEVEALRDMLAHAARQEGVGAER